MEAVIGDLQRSLDALGTLDNSVLGGGEVVVGLNGQLERLKALLARSAAAFDAGGEWKESGARNVASWIRVECRLPAGPARRIVSLGRSLRHMAATEAAWVAGEINEYHVSALAKARAVDAEAFGVAEADLLRCAREQSFASFSRLVSYWCYCANPDGAEGAAGRQKDSRNLHLSQSFEGMWFLNGVLDPVGGEILSNALQKIEKELFDADWAEARARLGQRAGVHDLRRTAAQRRADALVELATRAMAVAPGARRPAPLFSLLIDWRTPSLPELELGSRTAVMPGSILPWLDDAEWERILFDEDDRVISVGRRHRLFRGAARRAVQTRDRECFHDYCDEPAERCDIDHVRRWRDGGETHPDNGRPGCRFHNDEREKEEQRGEEQRRKKRRRSSE